ncbi:hypothetical protein B0A52_08497 [Exophiala mesophila]|uniref:Uncharacterized protein n=1 Tax=Exophiala mesophila TaxID=212818 RepID=A0A438MVV8_EXOME|nr:hypothetical protein B0A52_08497 [Exophiala mesophila]
MWSTAASWVALLALTAALTKYYNPQLFDRLTQQAVQASESIASPKPVEKRQKTKRTHTSRVGPTSGTSTPTSAGEGVAHKRRKLASTTAGHENPVQPAAVRQSEAAEDDEASMSNKDFAQRLSKTQAGTSLAASKATGTSKKERRAAKKARGPAGGPEASAISTASSVTDGPDAEDDFSLVGSPSTGPVSTAPTSRADDVSDMLEAPAAKPTTLRLTDVKEKIKSLPKTVSNKFEPVLSKKQRQRQAKQAEQKALKEESDRLHDAKKQQQLRTARTAAGTSNQTKADNFAAKQNAWQSGKPTTSGTSGQTAEVRHAPLLDTFDPVGESAKPVNGAVSSEPLSNITNVTTEATNVNQVRKEQGESKTNAMAASSREKVSRPELQAKASWADEVNDEEQDQWASELVQDEKWESVTSKKGKKKARKDVETSSEASSSAPKTTVTETKSLSNGLKSKGTVKAKIDSGNRFASMEDTGSSSLKDADWEA